MTMDKKEKNRLAALAASRARQKLVKAHKAEYDRLCLAEYKELGIKVTPHSKSKSNQLRKKREQVAKLKEELKHAEALLQNNKNNEQELFALWKQSVGL
jgi:hypothetical protein